jgi:hypothetical protein
VQGKELIYYKNHDRKPSQCVGVADLINVEPASFFACPASKAICSMKTKCFIKPKRRKT